MGVQVAPRIVDVVLAADIVVLCVTGSPHGAAG
jgi:hypothetical protein